MDAARRPLPQPRWFGIPAKFGYLIGVRFAGTVLGNVFMWSNDVFYPDYAPGEADWNISPLTDQSIAGVIMTVGGGLRHARGARSSCSGRSRTPSASGWWTWPNPGGSLCSERAERAVRAGTGGRLEERLRQGARERGRGRSAAGSRSSSSSRVSTRFLYVLVFVVGTASLGPRSPRRG